MFVATPTISARSRPSERRSGSPFLLDGFRPFYLGGAIFAALAVPLWLGMWNLSLLSPSLPPLYWHMHEMVYGFAVAFMTGFLFTAARNWTGLPLPSGTPLAVLFALWVAARVGMLAAYGPVTAVLDSSLMVIVAGALGHKFVRARSWHNLPLVAALLAIASTNITFHCSLLGLIDISPMAMVEFGLMLVVLVEMIVGGRVVPGFTANALPTVWRWRSVWLHRGSFTLTASAFVTDLMHAPPLLVGTLALLASAAVATQALGWNPWATRTRPMLWILHAGYAFIPIGLLLMGLSAYGVAPRSAAIHTLVVGSMGGLIMGMITRTAQAHTGRTVHAGRVEIALYVLVLGSAVLRVGAALIPPVYLVGMFAAGAAWAASWSLFAAAYAPMLLGLRRRGAANAQGARYV